jgi:serine/threonine protein kinase
MPKPSRSPKPHSFPVELVAELDDLCVEREQARGSQGLGATFREQRIQELQTALLEFPQPVPGSILAGARLELVLEVGTFATVWRATRIDSGAECAVQVFHPNCAGRGRMLRHFRQGIGALRALTAAGAPASIVRFLGADDSQLAFSTTLIPGSDLNDIARRAWSIEKKMQVFSGVCDAVKFAHDHGVLHGDLRPANVLYDEQAHGPVLKDFDLAEVSERGMGATSPHWYYAAPELKQGSHDRLRESDVYSLGRLLQYLITEQNPEAGSQLSTGDETIARIIATCTSAEPGQRYGDVAEIQSEVRRWRSGLSISATRQSVHPPTHVPPQKLAAFASPDDAARAPWGKILACCAGLGLLGSLVAFAWNHRSEFGWGSTAVQPVRAPDAGPVPAPKKKPRAAKRSASERGEPGVNLNASISRLFSDNSAAFERCHSGVAFPAADLTGRVVTRFKVDADGVLSEARLLETNVKATSVAKCVVAAHDGLRLDKKPGQPTYAQSRYDIDVAPE